MNQLAALYGPSSVLVHIGARIEGREGIAKQLLEVTRMHAAFGHVKHEVSKVDAQPVVFDTMGPADARGCVLVTVTGAMSLTSPGVSRASNEAFVEAFLLQVLGAQDEWMSSARSRGVVVHYQAMRLV